MPSAFAQIAEAVRKTRSAKWVHGVAQMGPVKTEIWVSFDPLRMADKSGARVTFVEGDAYRMLLYEPEKNTIRIQDFVDARIGAFDSLLDYAMDMFAKEQARGASLDIADKTIDGRKCKVFTIHIGDEEKQASVIVDQGTKRLVRLEFADRGGNRAVDFDYP